MRQRYFAYRVMASAVIAVAVLIPRSVSQEHQTQLGTHSISFETDDDEHLSRGAALEAQLDYDADDVVRGQRKTLVSPDQYPGRQRLLLRRLQGNIFTHKSSKDEPPPQPPLPGAKGIKDPKAPKSKKAKSKGVINCKGKGKGKGSTKGKSSKSKTKAKGIGPKMGSSKFLCPTVPTTLPTNMPTRKPTFMNSTMVPTRKPTAGTLKPTLKPTGTPTKPTGTFAPTTSSRPSTSPSASHAPSSSSKPSSKPTNKPTNKPTFAPSPATMLRNDINTFPPTTKDRKPLDRLETVPPAIPEDSPGMGDITALNRDQEGRIPSSAPSVHPSSVPTSTPRNREGQGRRLQL